MLSKKAQRRGGALGPDPAVDDTGDHSAVVLLAQQAPAIGAEVDWARGTGGEQEQPEHGGCDGGAG